MKCQVGEDDHIHCFVSAPPKISVTQIVKYLKGISGNTLLKEFPEIRNICGKDICGVVRISAKLLVQLPKKIY